MAVYFIRRKSDGLIKIGKSGRVGTRLRELEKANETPLEILGIVDGGIREEKELHAKFTDHRVEGEWFSPDEEVVDYINSNAEEFVPLGKPFSERNLTRMSYCQGIASSGKTCGKRIKYGGKYCYHHIDQKKDD